MWNFALVTSSVGLNLSGETPTKEVKNANQPTEIMPDPETGWIWSW